MSNETNASRAYQHLRRRLLAGDFAPGTRLLYGPIGKEIGVSATPVREAVGQLANEGLLELVPQLGAVVRSIDRQELIDIYEVRLAIEPYAARLAATRADAKQVAGLLGDLTRMRELTERQAASGAEFANKRLTRLFDKADYGFHIAVIEATGNRAMLQTAGQSHVLTRVFGIRRHRYDAASMRRTCTEHEAILDAIRAEDSDAAVRAATAHIRQGLQLSLRAMDDRKGEG